MCIENPQNGHFLNEKEKIISKCPEGCLKCSSTTECSECDYKNGHFEIRDKTEIKSSQTTCMKIIYLNF